jgi:hypothetical protein
MSGNQTDVIEVDDVFTVAHEALVACRDLAADAVGSEGDVTRPIARYRLDKVQHALLLIRRGLEPGPEAAQMLLDVAAERLAPLSPSAWRVWGGYFLQLLEAEADEDGYRAFLEDLVSDVDKRLRDGHW